MGGKFTQFYPPRAAFTEKDIPSQQGKVFIVTGGNAGLGFEISKILYAKGGTVYMASRSQTKIDAAIEEIKYIPTATGGQIKGLLLDLSDLSTIKSCASKFFAQETRLDVLLNNAGISSQPVGSTSVQGHESHMATNCLGPYLLTKLLLPILLQTAKRTPGVRVIFTSSGIVDINTPPGGLSIAELQPGNFGKDNVRNYGASKAGNWFLASEFDKRARKDGIVCITQNPGNLRTKIWNTVPWAIRTVVKLWQHDPIMGAYSVLWAGLSPDVKIEDGGRYSIPWGRWHPSPREDILASLKSKKEGGTGLSEEFWAWCEEQTKKYA
jgi:NAD(P)-dependent dehydrogenase (short-subunit alcohol dehydrogenase family)